MFFVTIISLFFCYRTCSISVLQSKFPLNKRSNHKREKIKLEKQKLQLCAIIDYEIKTRSNFLISFFQKINLSFTFLDSLSFLIQIIQQGEKLTNFKEIIITRAIIYLIHTIIGTLDIIRKKEIKYCYNSYKNRLTTNELRELQKHLLINCNKEKLRKILLNFINTKNLKDINFYNLDPIRWAISTKIADKIKGDFKTLQDKSNEEIIDGIIASYKLNISDHAVNFGWMLMILNILCFILIVIIIKHQTQKEINEDDSTDSEERTNPIKKKIPMLLENGVWPTFFSLTEFFQIFINKKSYNVFIKDIEKIRSNVNL